MEKINLGIMHVIFVHQFLAIVWRGLTMVRKRIGSRMVSFDTRMPLQAETKTTTFGLVVVGIMAFGTGVTLMEASISPTRHNLITLAARIV